MFVTQAVRHFSNEIVSYDCYFVLSNPPQALYYTADAQGPDDNGATNSGPMLTAWTNVVPLADGQTQSSVCEGALQAGLKRDDNTYCTSAVVPKSFTEKY